MLAKKKTLQKYLTRQRIQAALILVLSLLLLYQSLQLFRFKDEMAFLDALKEQNSDVLQDLSQGKEYLSNFGQDLNEIRKFLLLPTKDYNFETLAEVDLASEDEGEEGDLDTLLFAYVEKLGEYEKDQKRYQENLAALQTGLAVPYWNEQGLQVDASGQYSDEEVRFSFKDNALGVELMTLRLSYTGDFSLETFNGPVPLSENADYEAIDSLLRSMVEEELPGLRVRIENINENRLIVQKIMNSQSVQTSLKIQMLSMSTELTSAERYYYEIRNKDGKSIATLSIFKKDGSIGLNLNSPFPGYESQFGLTVDTVESQLLTVFEEGLDVRTDSEIAVAKVRAQMEDLFDDTAFQAVLGELGLNLGPREETSEAIRYPIFNTEGELLRVIFIDKKTAEVKVELPDGGGTNTLSAALESFHSLSKKKPSTRLFT